ncbi:MAG TPA: autoinducer binding domain-containing protein [Coxiellaceae bacterium]|nr:MAG: hypothetical protein A3E81_02980 [Gammaproteobacteria bacterium RIFCSPHIGHO2_12_FULL_36_30]HLB56279.1 autoinducer binding domain-containing protein [Coxiellaceae bacterium]
MTNNEFPDYAKKIFYNLFQTLSYKYGCTYFSYYVEVYEHQKRLSFTTDRKWTEIFISENLIKDCPLMHVGWNAKKIILDWDTAPITTKQQRNVVGIRSEFGYSHGVSFSNKVFGLMESLGMATDKTNKLFKELILEDTKNISNILKQFSCVSHKVLALNKLTNQYHTAFATMPLTMLANEII